MSWTVQQRTREIGVRMALGAGRARVLAMVLRRAAILALAGTLIGIAGAAALRRVLATLVFGIGPADPLTYATAAAAMFVVALLACWLPARRASRIDPAVALRSE
jgi:ABC-type antimicrobial peptide transport system permease subunit